MGWAKYEEDNRIIMEERWEAKNHYSPAVYAEEFRNRRIQASQMTNKSQTGGNKNGNKRNH